MPRNSNRQSSEGSSTGGLLGVGVGVGVGVGFGAGADVAGGAGGEGSSVLGCVEGLGGVLLTGGVRSLACAVGSSAPDSSGLVGVVISYGSTAVVEVFGPCLVTLATESSSPAGSAVPDADADAGGAAERGEGCTLPPLAVR
jgi:hypothetical protein